jgi:hypothetical protein
VIGALGVKDEVRIEQRNETIRVRDPFEHLQVRVGLVHGCPAARTDGLEVESGGVSLQRRSQHRNSGPCSRRGEILGMA